MKLSVYDLLGREVKILVNKYQSKGNYDVIFDASNFSSGIYIYKLVMGRFIMTKKMIFIKWIKLDNKLTYPTSDKSGQAISLGLVKVVKIKLKLSFWLFDVGKRVQKIKS